MIISVNGSLNFNYNFVLYKSVISTSIFILKIISVIITELQLTVLLLSALATTVLLSASSLSFSLLTLSLMKLCTNMYLDNLRLKVKVKFTGPDFSPLWDRVKPVNTITLEPLHLGWCNFAWTCTSTTCRTLLNLKVILKGQGHVVFLCVFCVAPTRGCMNLYLDNLLKPVKFQGHRSKVKVTRVFCAFLSVWYCGYPGTVLSLEQGLTILSLFLLLTSITVNECTSCDWWTRSGGWTWWWWFCSVLSRWRARTASGWRSLCTVHSRDCVWTRSTWASPSENSISTWLTSFTATVRQASTHSHSVSAVARHIFLQFDQLLQNPSLNVFLRVFNLFRICVLGEYNDDNEQEEHICFISAFLLPLFYCFYCFYYFTYVLWTFLSEIKLDWLNVLHSIVWLRGSVAGQLWKAVVECWQGHGEILSDE